MGYRSEVRCVIYGNPDLIGAAVAKSRLSGSLDATKMFEASLTRYKANIEVWHADGTRDDGGVGMWQPEVVEVLDLYGGNWKWYDGYGDVQAWEAFMQDCADTFGLKYEFIRIGEDVGDVDCRDSGDVGDCMLGTSHPTIIDEIDRIADPTTT